MLDAPGTRGPDDAVEHRIGEQPPVGADDAVEAVSLAEQPGDHAVVEPEADLLVLGPDGHPVVRHHLGGAGLDRGRERDEVVVEVAAGIDLLAAVREVRVLAVELWPAAGEVLRHAGNALGPERLELHAAEVGGDQARDDVGILAERPGRAAPAWLGRQIRRGVEGQPDADGEVLLSHDVGELAHEARIAGRSQPDRVGPLREARARHARGGVVAEAVPRVRRDRDRDPEPRRLGRLLHPVVPLGERDGTGGPVDVEVGQAELCDQGSCRDRREPVGLSPTAPSSGTSRP